MIRRRSAVVICLACAACLCLSGRRDPNVASAAPQPAVAAMTPSALNSYRVALLLLRRPENMEFQYTQTKSGPNQIVTEQHRVYWTSEGQERNDTISHNGTPVVPAKSSLLHRTVWPYDVAAFAAPADEYDATGIGLVTINERKTFGFRLARKAPADFMLRSIYIDVVHRLPVRETFAVTGATCSATGSIDFGPTGPYWLPTSVTVVCTGAGLTAGSAPIFKESIRFFGFTFPAVIPADVFVVAPASQAGAQGGAASP